jgi:phosphatidyl-myo-inositol alpha-mannosyltransferase
MAQVAPSPKLGRMNIIEVSPYDLDRKGGVQRHIHSLSAALETRGHKVLVIGPGTAPPTSSNRINLGRMRQISMAGTAFEICLASRVELNALDQRLAAFKPDIIHYHAIWTPLLPWQIFRRQRCASIATFHDTTSQDATGAVLRTVFKPLSRYLLNRLDGAITVSTAPLAHLRPGSRGSVPEIIPPVTDLSAFFALAKSRQQNRPTVLYVGRLERRKGVGTLLEAWRKVRDAMPAQLMIAGSGELEKDVLAAQRDMGEDAIVHLPAPDDQRLRDALSAATIAVSPALYGESFGIVLTEALASGTPIIGADNPGYRHVLTGEGAELLVPAGDAGALADKIAGLLTDPASCRRLAAWGRQHVRQFDVAATVGRFEAAFGAAIARHDGP